MSTDQPIACSLSAAELPGRLTALASVGGDALAHVECHDRRAMLRFHARPGIRDRLAAIVAAEARCCAFLSMRLHEEAGVVVLTIDAPEGAEPVLGDLVAAFGGPARPIG